MIPIVPGYRYELANHEHGSQPLQFVQRSPSALSPLKANTPRKLNTTQDGTTNEEVLAALIHRMIHLNQLLPCSDNFLVAHHLELALTLLSNRTQDRVKRGVEGTAQV